MAKTTKDTGPNWSSEGGKGRKECEGCKAKGTKEAIPACCYS